MAPPPARELGTGSSLEPGRRLGRYEICAELAAGGMATVYLARVAGPAGFEKLVALKCIHQRLAHERAFVEMFLDEARIASRITHANVCSVFDVGEVDGVYFLAMDYLHGESLASILGCVAERMDQRALPRTPIFLASIVAAAAEGLHAAHELVGDGRQKLEVVHRDVSPHNVFVGYDGGVRVVDFGIARATDRLHRTLSGVVKGKVAYMSPEQLRGDEVDRRTDTWALGVTLWELVACRRLFRRASQGDTMKALLEDPISPPSTFAPHVPPALDAAIMAALERDPAKRPATSRDFGRELRRVVAASGELVGSAEIAEWMDLLFAEHRAAKERMIDAARRGLALSEVPDTQRFARPAEELAEADADHVSELRARPARDEMQTLRDGGMAAVGAPAATVSTVVGEPGEPDAPSDPSITAAPKGALSRSVTAPIETPVARAPRNVWDDHRASAVTSTGPLVLPVASRTRALAIAGLVVVALLAIAFAVVASMSRDAEDPGVESSSGVAPSEPVLPPAMAAPRVSMESIDAPPPVTEEAHPPAPASSPTKRAPRTGGTMDAPPTEPVPARTTASETATPVPAPETETPAPAGPGWVRVGVRGGWGTVAIDGRDVGQAPGRFEVAVGVHRVAVRPFGEGSAVVREIRVEPGRTAAVVVDAP